MVITLHISRGSLKMDISEWAIHDHSCGQLSFC